MKVGCSKAYISPTAVPKMPAGLVEIMEGLSREVLMSNPSEILEFCAEHMRKLLEIRDSHPPGKCLTLEKKIHQANNIIRQRAEKRRQKYDNDMQYLGKDNFLSDQPSYTILLESPHQVDDKNLDHDMNGECLNSNGIVKDKENEYKKLCDKEIISELSVERNGAHNEHQNNCEVDEVINCFDNVAMPAVDQNVLGKNNSEDITNPTNAVNELVDDSGVQEHLKQADKIHPSQRTETHLENPSNNKQGNEDDGKLLMEFNSENSPSIEENVCKNCSNTTAGPVEDTEKPVLFEINIVEANDTSKETHEKQNNGNQSVIEVNLKKEISVDEKSKPEYTEGDDNVDGSNVLSNNKAEDKTLLLETDDSKDDGEKIVIENVNATGEGNKEIVVSDENIVTKSTANAEGDGPNVKDDYIINEQPIGSNQILLKNRENLHIKDAQVEEGSQKNELTKFEDNEVIKASFLESNIVIKNDAQHPETGTVIELSLRNIDQNIASNESGQGQAFDEIKIQQNFKPCDDTHIITQNNSNIKENLDIKVINTQNEEKPPTVIIESEQVDTINNNDSNSNQNIITDINGSNEGMGKSAQEHELLDPKSSKTMDIETAAITIQKVFRNFLFKSKTTSSDDSTNIEYTEFERESDTKDTAGVASQNQNVNKDRRTRGINRMDTVLQTVNEEKSLSLSTDDSSTLSSAATVIQAHLRGFLVRNRLNRNKTKSSTHLVDSDEPSPVSLEADPDSTRNKTVLNIHIVPEGDQFISRDESLFTSMELSLDGSPPASTNLHPLGYDISERRKQLKREDAIQSISPPSNNCKLSEERDSVKEVFVSNIKVETEQTEQIGDEVAIDSQINTSTAKDYILPKETGMDEDSPNQNTKSTSNKSVEVTTETSSDELDVVTPFVPIEEKSSETNNEKLLHSGEFHDVVLPTKVSRNDTSVVSDFQNVLVYFLVWNNS